MEDKTSQSQGSRLNLNLSYSRVRNEDGRAAELNPTTSEVQLDGSFKRQNHISWNDAWRAENDRERARLISCNQIPTAGPIALLAANVARELPNIKARAFRYFTWMSFRRRANSTTSQKQGPGAREAGDLYVFEDANEELAAAGKTLKQEPTLRRDQ
jgi:hypothetical protein